PRPPRAVPRRRRVHRHRGAGTGGEGLRPAAHRLVRVGADVPLAELLDLGGRAALVTGAAQGFGFACARRLAEAGAAVLLVDRRREPLEAAVARLDEAGASVAP